MIILDTDHLIEFEKGSSDAAARLQSRLVASGDEIATTIVSIEEVLRGWLAEIHRRTDPRLQISAYSHLDRFLEFVSGWEVLPWNHAAVNQFEALRLQKVRVATMDLKIACIAISLGAKLITRNLNDFQKIPSVDVEDWLS